MKKSEDPIFEAARKGVDSFLGMFQKPKTLGPIEFKRHSWKFIKEKDPKSPKIMQLDDGIGETKRFLVYYPKDSTPYHVELEDDFKRVTILDGEIHDKASGKVYKKDDVIIFKPGDRIMPKTSDDLECHVFVEVSCECLNSNDLIRRNCNL